jgi:hypothetical protein
MQSTNATVAFDGEDAARAIYSRASQAAGENTTFTDAVATLVGRPADSYEDLADHFACEARVMQDAAALARKLATPHDTEGHCDKCGADKVKVRTVRKDGVTVRICLSCDTFG